MYMYNFGGTHPVNLHSAVILLSDRLCILYLMIRFMCWFFTKCVILPVQEAQQTKKNKTKNMYNFYVLPDTLVDFVLSFFFFFF